MKMEKIKIVSATAAATLSNLLFGITSYADTFDTGWLTTDDNGKLAEITQNTKGYFASVYGLVCVVCVVSMALLEAQPTTASTSGISSSIWLR